MCLLVGWVGEGFGGCAGEYVVVYIVCSIYVGEYLDR